MNISVIIPSYNEEKNLIQLIPELKKNLTLTDTDFEIITVDAMASRDNTEKICEENEITYVRQKNKGYADAFRTGISLAKNDILLVVDADNCQDISKIPEMYKAVCGGADVVIGSRYVKGGKTSDGILNVIMSKILNTAYSLVLDLKQKDISTDFRMYNMKKLKSINTECENFDVIEETLFLLQKTFPDIVIKEIPINYKKRLEGNSKRRLLTFIKGYIKLLFRLFRLKKRG